jgi:hypothetical protein
MEPDFISNEKFHAINVPDLDPDLLGPPEYLMAPVVETLQIRRELRFLGRIANDVFLEFGAYLRYKVMVITIALEHIIHLGLHDLLDMRLFDIIRGYIQADTEGPDDDNAKDGEGQRDT